MTTVDKHAPGTPGWFDLMTSDAAAARSFYGGLFGWTFDVKGPEFGHYAMCKLGDRNAAGLGGKPPGAPVPTAWSVYFITDDIDRACNRIRESGGNVTMPPMTIGEEGRMAMAADATGAVFGMWQPIDHRGAQAIEEPGAMAWCEVNTRDAGKAGAFYQAVFGLEPRKLDAPGMTYFSLHRGGEDKASGGVLQMDQNWPESVPPHWMAYFQVASTDQSCARVGELGGKVCVPAFDSPYGRIAVIEDPQGATFSIVQPPAA
jgi:uncharacterized protein